MSVYPWTASTFSTLMFDSMKTAQEITHPLQLKLTSLSTDLTNFGGFLFQEYCRDE